MPSIRNWPICMRSRKNVHLVSFAGFRRKRPTPLTSMTESLCRKAQVEDDFTMNPSGSLKEELKSWVVKR